jgi:3-deoxy-7-phosphoheptulonate synthase
MRKKNPDIHPALMIDCSHGNSSKNHLNQPIVAAGIAEQVAGGETGIVGIMSVVLPVIRRLQADLDRFESNLKGGKQSSDLGKENLEYGVSITDGEPRVDFCGHES